jgi:hypothetical protein
MTAEAATAAAQPSAAQSPSLRWHVPTTAPAQRAQRLRSPAHVPMRDQPSVTDLVTH